MPTEQVVALVEALNSSDPAAKAKAVELLRARLPGDTRFRLEAIAKFFAILGREDVPPERLADTFARIAEDHQRLRERLRAFESDDPEVQALREQADEALERADHEAARGYLEAARQVVRAKREALRTALAEQTREEAQLIAEQGGVERARLALAAAAVLYDEAANLVAPLDADAAREHLWQAASAWAEHGRDRGGNTALVTSIARWRSLLAQIDRGAEPVAWATTQNNLGAALQALGEREAGTGRLEEAVAAYRAALEERTRDRVPLQWARTQWRLGNALLTLGQRKPGTGPLEQAVKAFDLLIDEFSGGGAANKRTAAAFYNSRAYAHLYLGQAATALQDAERAVANAPKVGDYRDTLGDMLCRNGRVESALAAYAEALRISPDQADYKQRQLKAEGYYDGAVERVFGPAAEAALRNWVDSGCPGL